MYAKTAKFQSTHPHGVRQHFLRQQQSKCLSFNPRTHTGCDMVISSVRGQQIEFQSTHPHGVRPQMRQRAVFANAVFQSTHPHGVRLAKAAVLSGAVRVSIHAPTRGATRLLADKDNTLSVSIHAPTRGATHQLSNHVRGIRFNPRTHTGCDDLMVKQGQLTEAFVSIHAPTRGATLYMRDFNVGYLSFNPRTHTGCDDFDSVAHITIKVSIHAPTRGATCRVQRFSYVYTVSIHAPTRGATQGKEVEYLNSKVSIHAPTRGATQS